MIPTWYRHRDLVPHVVPGGLGMVTRASGPECSLPVRSARLESGRAVTPPGLSPEVGGAECLPQQVTQPT